METKYVKINNYTDIGKIDAPAHTIVFYNKNNKLVGTLYLDNPIRFEGITEESARIFFECIIKEYLGYVNKIPLFIKEEFLEEVKQALRRADKKIADLNEARKIDPKVLDEPMTI